MEKTITRVFSFDGDSCEVTFSYDEEFGKYFGDYPDFEETPKYTPAGRPWITAMQEGCTYSKSKVNDGRTCLDCGSCMYFRRERQGDLIGICDNDRNKNKRRRDG